jgi:hypothetical protein
VGNRARFIFIGLGLLLAVVLVVGGVSATRDDDGDSGTSVAAETTPAEPDPYPLGSSPTPENVRISVYERAYSECASTDLELLAAKYKVEDTSKEGVAAVVGRAWASYFDAGQDAVGGGRDGCLQGFSQP